MDVGLLHDREQRPLVPAPWLEQARKIGALAALGDLQLQVSTRVSRSRSR